MPEIGQSVGSQVARSMPSFYEFFAGGGMARAGLGQGWTCLFANDFDAKKAKPTNGIIPAKACCEWATSARLRLRTYPDMSISFGGSFPCQDLSLAGGGAGLKGERSGTFDPFGDIVKGLVAEGRGPEVASPGKCPWNSSTSHAGCDFEAICRTFAEVGAIADRCRLSILPIRSAVAASPVRLSACAPMSRSTLRSSRQAPSRRFTPRPYRGAFARASKASLEQDYLVDSLVPVTT